MTKLANDSQDRYASRARNESVLVIVRVPVLYRTVPVFKGKMGIPPSNKKLKPGRTTRGRSFLSVFIASLLSLHAASFGFCTEFPKNHRTVTISAIANEQTHAIAKDVLREVYHRIGYEVLFDDLPGQRALAWANNGLTDGDVARIDGTEKKYPNLIRITPPIIFFEGVVFSKTVTRRISRWEDLKGLRIGVIRGIRYSTIGTRDMDPFFADDMTHLFRILDKDRIEVAVAVLDAGAIEIKRNFRDSTIHVIGEPLYSAPLYHFVNVRNKDLVGKLEKVLSELTASGEIERLREQARERLLGN